MDIQKALDKIPGPVGILGAIDGDNHRIITVSWFTQVSKNPPQLLVCVSPQSSVHPIINKSKEFVLTILSKDMEEVARICGHTSENVSDKLDTAKLTTKTSKKVKVASINEGIFNLECQVTGEFTGGDHTIFVGEVLYVDEIKEEKPLIFYNRDLVTVDYSLSK
ncbi:flavin reductase family protein [Anaerobranca gottschalkii]|uniref:NADH-FMN oxidoreductase RutF, flavin reductase (DIM6/NTAB) family n=1 Tax=Anaerobranca gottschalkii DSM 13577 TaxID=1120990 RepID=A0A1I0C3V9_9FIRM|nr:flavin reductase family protein [Anaerobranca gottschalkii]SET13414.1 NADH-FMN oxidoreductase RutF, flavin reductase (DIM6/NTAB) family [Anaerobranca gottschalkii DSM 13577]